MLDPQYLSIYLFSWITPWFWSYLPLDVWFSKFHPAHLFLMCWWKGLLEILFFNLPFWIYLSFTLFTMCLVPLLSFQINTALDSSLNFWFQSTSSNSKILRWTAPRILMHVQVIWRMELLVHHEESSWIGNNTTCSHSCSCWMENSKRHQRIKSEAWARLWHSHY